METRNRRDPEDVQASLGSGQLRAAPNRKLAAADSLARFLGNRPPNLPDETQCMPSVYSHIIQKRLSEQNEDVATDALAYILESSDAAKKGMMKLLTGACPDLPILRFRTQQTEGSIRPDMWGFAGSDPRVYVENKFWAGVTDNQPVSYLNQIGDLRPTDGASRRGSAGPRAHTLAGASESRSRSRHRLCRPSSRSRHFLSSASLK